MTEDKHRVSIGDEEWFPSFMYCEFEDNEVEPSAINQNKNLGAKTEENAFNEWIKTMATEANNEDLSSNLEDVNKNFPPAISPLP